MLTNIGRNDGLSLSLLPKLVNEHLGLQLAVFLSELERILSLKLFNAVAPQAGLTSLYLRQYEFENVFNVALHMDVNVDPLIEF